MTAKLYLGRWQDALAQIDRVDAVITDPPYGARTHEATNAHIAGSDLPDGAERPAVAARSVQRLLGEMRREGRLELVGRTRGARWQLRQPP